MNVFKEVVVLPKTDLQRRKHLFHVPKERLAAFIWVEGAECLKT